MTREMPMRMGALWGENGDGDCDGIRVYGGCIGACGDYRAGRFDDIDRYGDCSQRLCGNGDGNLRADE